MGRTYDNWERLVEVVMRREQLRTLSLTDSRSPSTRSLDSDYSFSSSSWLDDNLSSRATPSPLHPDAVKLKFAKSSSPGNQIGNAVKVSAKRRNSMWKGLSIFGRYASKKDYGREESELKWAKDRKTVHGLEQTKIAGKQKYEKASPTAEEATRGAEIARLQELHTLKGHIESLLKAKGLDINSIQHYYTI